MSNMLRQKFTASLIMTPREKWVYWPGGNSRENFLDENGNLIYDVIPVIKEQKVVGIIRDRTFKIHPLTLDWCLTHDAMFDDLLKFFIEKQKPACFLLKRDDFIGLVTPADFNKAPARTACYFRLAELEMRLAQFIGFRVEEDKILNALPAKRKDKILKSYNSTLSGNVDVSLVERLYLTDLLEVVKKTGLFELLGYRSKTQFHRGTQGLVKLRNQVMHPVRPLVENDREALQHLYDRLCLIDRLSMKLKELFTREPQADSTT